MTDREKAIVMAYTGICTLQGDKLNEFYKYLADLYGRPVYTHEIVDLDIAEKSMLALEIAEFTTRWLVQRKGSQAKRIL